MSRDKENKNLPTVIRPECHFLEFPFCALSRKGLKDKTKLVFRHEEVREGERGVFEWKVLPSAEYGCPSPFDRRVMRAVDAVVFEQLKENGYPVENPLEFSIYHLADLMGYSTRGGKIYRDVRDSLLRIKLTGVESGGTFFLKDKKRWVYDVFNIYDRVLFKGEEDGDREAVDTNYLWLGDFVLRNINSQHVRPLNYVYLAGLKSDVAARLYEVLSGKFYSLIRKGGSNFNIDYLSLCQLLPIAPQRYISLVKQTLERAHNELKKTQFLEKIVFRKGKNGFVVVYFPGERAEELIKPTLPNDVADNQILLPFVREEDESIQLSDIGQELHSRGLSRSVSLHFCGKYPEKLIHEKIEMFDFLRSSGSETISKNPAGWLRKAIEEDWQPSEEQRKAKEGRARQDKEQGRQARWIEHRKTLIEQELNSWDDTSPEERVQGRLEFWIAGENLNGRPPTKKAIEEKQKELIDNLPKTDEERREHLSHNYPDHPPEDFE